MTDKKGEIVFCYHSDAYPDSNNQIVHDPRDSSRCQHQTTTIFRQRIYGLALGYEDLNDHQQLRYDLALQTATDVDKPLASQSTLCRFEQQANRQQVVRMHEVIIESFIASFMNHRNV